MWRRFHPNILGILYCLGEGDRPDSFFFGKSGIEKPCKRLQGILGWIFLQNISISSEPLSDVQRTILIMNLRGPIFLEHIEKCYKTLKHT